jgi:type IV pilus assembly protein PilC
VEQGRNIAGPLAETKVFPPMVIQMVGVGEATGALDAMLSKVADFYEDEVDNAVAAMTSMMEPLIIAILGGVIGFIVVAMYMPIFNLANVMGKD